MPTRTTTRFRRAAGAVASATACLAISCAPPPATTEGPPVRMPGGACTVATPSVRVHGDSNGHQIAASLSIPGYRVDNAAQGGSAFTVEVDGRPTIEAMVRQRLSECGAPARMIVQGSTNDITRARPAADIIASITRIRNELAAPGVGVSWVVQQPVPRRGGWSAAMLATRQQVNAFVTSLPGAVDCTGDLQDPAAPGWLHPRYEVPVDLLLNPDPYHLNAAGYRAYAACIGAAVHRS